MKPVFISGFPLLDSLQLPRLIDSAAQVISSHWNLIAPVANTATSIINSFTSGGTPKVQSSTIEPVPEAASFTTNSGPVLNFLEFLEFFLQFFIFFKKIFHDFLRIFYNFFYNFL